MKADYPSQGRSVLEWYLLPHIAWAAIHPWGQPDVDLLAYLHTRECQLNYTLENPLPLGTLGLNAFNQHWNYQVSNVFPPSFVPLVLSKFLAAHVTSQFRLLILVGPCLTETLWLPTVLSMLADVPHQHPIVQDLIIDISVGIVLKDLQSLHLYLWLLRDMYCKDKGSLLYLL